MECELLCAKLFRHQTLRRIASHRLATANGEVFVQHKLLNHMFSCRSFTAFVGQFLMKFVPPERETMSKTFVDKKIVIYCPKKSK